MAIMTPGPTVGQVSGRIGGIVYSRNRGGAYIRNGAIPTLSSTPYAVAAKARLADYSKLWADLTSVQKLAWKNWAVQNPVVNRLGHQITLSGHMAFVQLNVVISNAQGTLISDPPVVAPPSSLITLSATYDIGAGTTNLVFTPSPLGASECLEVWAAVSDNPGVAYVENLYKQIVVSAVATTSPQDWSTFVAARFGTLIVGQQVFFRIYVVDQDTGLKSAPKVTNGTIVST
jgi:hypothetical protein